MGNLRLPKTLLIGTIPYLAGITLTPGAISAKNPLIICKSSCLSIKSVLLSSMTSASFICDRNTDECFNTSLNDHSPLIEVLN